MKRLFSLCLVAALACCLSSCGGAKDNQGGPAVPVAAAQVVSKEMPVQIPAVGVIEPSESVSIVPQVGGVIKQVHFSEGQEVQKGDLLFTIDPDPFEAKLKQASAALARAKAESNNAQTQYQRYQGLIGKEYVSKDRFDQAKAQALAAEADEKAAEAALENAKLDLAYTAIRAPISGKTGDLLVKLGNVVKANELTSPLVKITALKPVYARFSVPEKYLPEIRARQSEHPLQVQVSVKGLDANSAISRAGQLSLIDNQVDRSTGTILLKARFENADEALWPGQFVDVTVTVKTVPNALTIASEAIQTGQQGHYVWVVGQDMTVSTRVVETAFSVGQETVLQSGLKEGERVVTDGQLRLAEGSKVKLK